MAKKWKKRRGFFRWKTRTFNGQKVKDSAVFTHEGKIYRVAVWYNIEAKAFTTSYKRQDGDPICWPKGSLRSMSLKEVSDLAVGITKARWKARAFTWRKRLYLYWPDK